MNMIMSPKVTRKYLGWDMDRVGCVQAMRETSQHYMPFGQYHFIHGAQIRTPDPSGSDEAGSPSSHAEYAERVRHQLDARHLPKIAWLTGGRTGGLMDHKVLPQLAARAACLSCYCLSRVAFTDATADSQHVLTSMAMMLLLVLFLVQLVTAIAPLFADAGISAAHQAPHGSACTGPSQKSFLSDPAA